MYKEAFSLLISEVHLYGDLNNGPTGHVKAHSRVWNICLKRDSNMHLEES